MKFLWVSHIFVSTKVRMLLSLCLAFNWFVISPLTISLPLMVKQHNIPEFFYGLLISTFSIGFIIGALVTPKIKKYFEQIDIAICIWSAFLCFIFISMLALPSILLYFIGIFFMGIIYGIFNIIITSWLQSYSPQHLMGHIMSVLAFTAIGTIPLCSILYRFVPNDLVQQVLLLSALVGLIVFLTLIVNLTRRRRNSSEVAMYSDVGE